MARTRAELTQSEVDAIENLDWVSSDNIVYKDGSWNVSWVWVGTWLQVTSWSLQALNNGDVTWPWSATDNAIARFDWTWGWTIQNSWVTVDDNDNISGAWYIDVWTFNDGSEPSANAWRIFYSNEEEVLSFYDTNGIEVNIWTDNVIKAKNVQWSTVNKWDVVYITWATGTNPEIQLAKADTVWEAATFWVVRQDISNNGVWKIITDWRIQGIDTSSFNVWDPLYLDVTTAWNLVNSKPTSWVVFKIWNVINSDASNWEIAIDTDRDWSRQTTTVEYKASKPLNIETQSTTPSSPQTDDIYLDDWTNTASWKTWLRQYNWSSWIDIWATWGWWSGSATKISLTAGENINNVWDALAINTDWKVYNYSSTYSNYIWAADSTATSGNSVDIIQLWEANISWFSASDNIYIWQTSSNWNTKANMTTARKALWSWAVDWKIYVIGGDTWSVTNKNEVYDPSTDSWARKANMTTSRKQHTVSVVNSKIYCIWGNNWSNVLATNEEYDPSSNTWTSKTDMPTARWQLSSAVVNSKIYVIGWREGSSRSNANEEYDPSTDSWTSKTNMPTARLEPISNAVNSKIYTIGGNDWSATGANEEYDPSGDSWTSKTNMTTAREWLSSWVINSKIYVIGGSNWSDLSTNEQYDPSSDSWTSEKDMPTARQQLTTSVVNKTIYSIWGNWVSDKNEEYLISLPKYNNVANWTQVWKALSSSKVSLFKF